MIMSAAKAKEIYFLNLMENNPLVEKVNEAMKKNLKHKFGTRQVTVSLGDCSTNQRNDLAEYLKFLGYDVQYLHEEGIPIMIRINW